MPSPTDPEFVTSKITIKDHLVQRATFYPDTGHHVSVNADARLYVWGSGGDSGYTFQDMRSGIAYRLSQATSIHRGKWQTMDVSDSPAHATKELRNVNIFYTVPDDILKLQDEVQPDLPWAEAHFEERVGGEPVNPPPSFVQWPHHNGDANLHVTDEVFSHTYPERFWPKWANNPKCAGVLDCLCNMPNQGYRYECGDLNGVVDQLVANPLTRQAVLPVWFPEDTGAINRRVPCSLTYHFMADENMRLSVWYSLRACDFVRHFHNDVYLAARLLQWMCHEVNNTQGNYSRLMTPGELNITISSLHVFKGDLHKMAYSG